MNIISSTLYKNRIIFFEKENRALCELTTTGQIRIIGFIHEARNASHLFAQNNKIYLLGNGGMVIEVTEKPDGKNEIETNIYNNKLVYSHIRIIGNSIIFFPLELKEDFLIYDMTDESFSTCKLWGEYVKKHIKSEKAPFYNSSTDDIYIPIFGTNSFIVTDIFSRIEHCSLIGDYKLSSGLFDGINFYFSLIKGAKIGIADKTGKLLEVLEPFKSEIEGEFSNIVDCGDRVCYLPRYGDTITIVEKEENRMFKINLSEYGIFAPQERSMWSKICNCLRFEERIIFFGNGIIESFSKDIKGNDLRLLNPLMIKDLYFWDWLQKEEDVFIGGETKERQLLKYLRFLGNNQSINRIMYGK